MALAPLVRVWVFLAFCHLIAVGTAVAEIPRSLPPQGTLQAVLDRIHDHAANDAWKNPGFKDEGIEKWLDKLVGSVAKATEFPELTLPVRWNDVQAKDVPVKVAQAKGVPVARLLQSALLIGRDLDLKDASLKKSIVLADGNVIATRVDECVIIARGVVTIQMSSTNSVIVSGVYVDLGQYDGVPRNATNGSLVVSRGWADVGTAYGTMIAAPEGISVGRAESAMFLNAPVPAGPAIAGFVGVGRDNGSRSVKVDLSLEALPVHPFATRIALLGISHGPRIEAGILGREQRVFGPRGIVFNFDDRTHVAETGEPIVDEDGNLVESLRNWRLSCVNAKFAILVGPDDNAVLKLEKKP